MAFLEGLKGQMGGLAAAGAAKMASAKEFVDSKTAEGPLKQVKDQMGGMASKAGSAVSSIAPAGLSKYLPLGGGKKQSPIDIVTSEARFDESLGDGQMQFNYVASEAKQLVNSGHSLMVNMVPGGTSSLQAIHLNGQTYVLKQIHFTWGTEPMNGSQHTIGGVGYAGEVHLIHANSKYGEFEDACKHNDGLAILAVFLNETHDDNVSLSRLINLIDKVAYMHDYMPLDHGFDPRPLIPDKGEFWTYEGSLPFHPYSESAIWTVFRASIPVSGHQLERLRNLWGVTAEQASENPDAKIHTFHRGVQPTHGRLIRSSFRSGGIIPEN